MVGGTIVTLGLSIWVLLGVSLAGSAYYQIHQLDKPSRARTLAKAVVTSPLAVMSVLFEAPITLTIAFVLSSIVDVVLSYSHSKKYLVAAMAIQSVSLVLYAYTFSMFWVGFPSLELALLVLGGWGAGLLAVLWSKLDFARVPVITYMGCVLLMMTVSFGIDDQHRLAALGAVLFAISTSIHAVEQFHFERPSVLYTYSGPPIWISYYAAMLSFAFAFV